MKDGRSFWLQPWETIEQAKRAVIFGARDDEDFNKTTESDCMWMDHFLEIQPEDQVLDVGCGVGRLMKPLAEKCAKVTGVDVNENMIRFAEEYLDGVENTACYVFNGVRLPFGDNTFDKAFSFITVMHIEKHEAFVLMSEVFRVLKEGGRFVFNVPNLLSQREQYLRYLGRYVDVREVIVRMEVYTPQEVQAKLEIIGFQDIEARDVSTEVFGYGVKKTQRLFPGTASRIIF